MIGENIRPRLSHDAPTIPPLRPPQCGMCTPHFGQRPNRSREFQNPGQQRADPGRREWEMDEVHAMGSPPENSKLMHRAEPRPITQRSEDRVGLETVADSPADPNRPVKPGFLFAWKRKPVEQRSADRLINLARASGRWRSFGQRGDGSLFHGWRSRKSAAFAISYLSQ